MKITDIASTLNDSIMKITQGETAVVKEDLTNIIDVGKTVLDYVSAGNGNFNTYVEGLVDQIGKFVFWDRTYNSKAPKISVESWEWGSIMAKTRCFVPDFVQSPTYTLQTLYKRATSQNLPANLINTPEIDPFELNLPEAEAKFYNHKDVFDLAITIGKKQLEAAFTSPEQMQRFINMIENRIRMKQVIATDALIYRTIANFMGLKIAQNKYIDLMAAYNAEYGTSYNTYEQCVNDVSFLRFASMVIDNYRSYMQEASVLFNDDGYVCFTPEDRMKFVMLKDFEGHMKSELYSTTFNDDYVKLGGYEIVNSWQGPGTGYGSSSNRGRLYVQCTDGNDTYDVCSDVMDYTDPSNPTLTSTGVVVAALFDRDGCAVCNEDPRVTSQYNPRAEYTNFFYKWDASYINDTVENGIIFTIGTPTVYKHP